ncbi:Transmembrane GTPase-like protein [Emericellopsis cladophorae]|uniref:Transmembrane GTPase-like protein n=1 Tax=Emericellopsis cladophorae TaxID=2686198 RepID=A0A9P9Y775_9HYPO|nr:Transmembrane GTPase-like protein [Emericellopsis cladophorae]KAI6784766.1 Transmembrane GTPase-like protein [Emericellopsis cladophorae]
MSEDYFSGKGKAPMSSEPRESDDKSDSNNLPADGPRNVKSMTVGNGLTSRHIAHVQNMLNNENDSGYGGSIADADHPSMSSAVGSHPHGQPQSGAIHQMWYNQQMASLSRSIGKALELLKGLREMNESWPAHYPSVQRADVSSAERPQSRPGLGHAYSTMGDVDNNGTETPPPQLRRAMTSLEAHDAESSRAAENRVPEPPRLVTPQIAQEFSILKLDLKLGALSQVELVHSLEKNSIAALLDGKISTSIKHLISLRDRISDTASKVLITGDLNAGKSTFCNALLRRKVLPEDQQPCTSIFCEVLDARENSNVEEVHAVHKGSVYDRIDESTYDVYTLQELEKIVVDNDKYTQCKVYVKDSRTIDESLLNNGVVDIALIDAPGLNSDTTKTTAIFARQEEIDVVVFVVSAANHFTQSAKEFIWAAAAEKAYIFIVVNGYDTIRDKERCKKLVLDQVSGLSPRTHKESDELVHFVSSNAVPVGGPSESGGGGDDDPDDGDKGKGKADAADKVRDFEAAEQSLRRFVLEKRARSKLAPARTYLLNILNDVQTLASVNHGVAQSELDRVRRELREIEPQLDSSRKARNEVSDQIDHNIEDTCKEVYDNTRSELTSAIEYAGNYSYDLPYPGLFGAFQYAEDLKSAMLSHITQTVAKCEDFARAKSVQGVNATKQLGILHVGDEFKNLKFLPDVMFQRKKDALARQVDIPTELWDFVDWTTLLQQQEKFAGTGMALTVAGAVVPRMIGMSSWVDQALMATRLVGSGNLRTLVIPGLLVAVFAASAYVVQQIPNSLPPRLANKISAQLAELDYVHSNSTRIATAVRRVLRVPADNLRVGLEQSVKELGDRREETIKVKGESERASKYFSNLVRSSENQRNDVLAIDLDALPHGQVQ